jgi:hypothetical protein
MRNGALAYSTFLGGSALEIPTGIAIGNAYAPGTCSDVYLSGLVLSTDFPTSTGAYAITLAGQQDGFLTWLRTDSLGPADLRYSTYWGGPHVDSLSALAVEDSGILTAVGSTSGGVLGTPGARVITSSPEDVVLLRLDPANRGTRDLHYLSFVSTAASFGEVAFAMDLARDGFVTMAGAVDGASFPTSPGSLQSGPGGSLDAFAMTFDPLPVGVARLGVSTQSAYCGSLWTQVAGDLSAVGSTMELVCNGVGSSLPGVCLVGGGHPGYALLDVMALVSPIHFAMPVCSDARGAWRAEVQVPPGLGASPTVYLQWVWLAAPFFPPAQLLCASHAVGF